MYNVSDELKSKLNSNTVTSTARLTFSDPQLVIDENNLVSLKLRDYCYNEGRIIGTNIAKDLEIVIKNNNYDLQDKEFYLEIGILLDSGEYEYIPYGYFIIDTVEDTKSNNEYKITAMDYMIKLNQTFVEFDASEYPMTMRRFLEKFAEQYGIELVPQTLPNENLEIPSIPFFTDMSGRTVLKNMAEVFGKFAKFNREGKLEFVLKNEVLEQISRDNMNSNLEIDNQYGEVNVVSILLSDDVIGENVTLRDEESIALYGENIIKIVDNEFLNTQDMRLAAIEELFNALKGFKYVPTSFTYMGKPYLDCGDSILVQNMETDTYYESIVLNHSIEIATLRKSKMENLALTKTEVESQFTPEMIKKTTRTEIRVNKVENDINLLAQEQTNQNEKISNININIDSINSSVKLLGGNNLQRNSLGAYGTGDFLQNENGELIATEEELLKSKTDNGFGRVIYATNGRLFTFKSEQLTIGEMYTLSFKYSNMPNSICSITFNNNIQTSLVHTTEEKDLEKVVYTFVANTEFVELTVHAEEGTILITDYYLQVGTEATKWQAASGEALSTSLEIYYNGIKVRSASSEIITDISNLGFTVKNRNEKILITFNKDKCILSDTEMGSLQQDSWLRYVQKINNKDMLLEVKI